MGQSIRSPNTVEFSRIMEWLRSEYEKDGEGFWCNRNVLEDAFEKGDFRAIFVADDPVGFLANGLTRDGVMSIRKDQRSKGLGTNLAQYAIDSERNSSEIAILEIQSAPITSRPFWEKLGFNFFTEDRAYLEFNKKFDLPIAEEIAVEVALYLDPGHHNGSDSPLNLYAPKAVRTPDKVIHLNERLLFNLKPYPRGRDGAIKVTVGGRTLFCDKLKRAEAARIGVCTDLERNYFMDRVYNS